MYTFQSDQFANKLEAYTPTSTYGPGSLAPTYKAVNAGLLIDVVGKFAWTLTPPTPDACNVADARSNAPYIILREYEVNESSLLRSLKYYSEQIGLPTTEAEDYLGAYDELFPRDPDKSGIVYKFPYFNDINFETTSSWQSLDNAETLYTSAKNLVTGTVSTLLGQGAGSTLDKIFGAGEAAVKGGMALAYPKVGIMDRPKLWSHHDFRSITFSFPLFNTHNFDERGDTGSPIHAEWFKNRELCWLFTTQNLYNKRSFITGIPPVYYTVRIPGQYFSRAAYVSNLTIYNRGNMRVMDVPIESVRTGGTGIPDIQTINVPDVYEVQITLTDMIMPSKNLMQAIFNEKIISRCE